MVSNIKRYEIIIKYFFFILGIALVDYEMVALVVWSSWNSMGKPLILCVNVLVTCEHEIKFTSTNGHAHS